MSDKGSVTGRITQYIQRNIADGTWKVGETIPSENQLCKELGVSRVSVRNALQQFTSLGILESVRGKGTYLSSNDLTLFSIPDGIDMSNKESIERMRNILEFRCLVEPDVCSAVAQNASQDLIDLLGRYLADMQHNVGNAAEFVSADMAFHLAICKASDNPIVYSVMADLFQKRAELGHMLNLTAGYYGGIYYHSLILDAIKSHDSRHAKTFMLEHLQKGIYDIAADNKDYSHIYDSE